MCSGVIQKIFSNLNSKFPSVLEVLEKDQGEEQCGEGVEKVATWAGMEVFQDFGIARLCWCIWTDCVSVLGSNEKFISYCVSWSSLKNVDLGDKFL